MFIFYLQSIVILLLIIALCYFLIKRYRDKTYLWKVTFDAVPDLIALLDIEGRVIKVNQAVIDYLKIPEDEIRGRYCFDIFHRLDARPLACLWDQAINGGCNVCRETFLDDPDTLFHVSIHPMIKRSKVLGCVHIARNITEVKHMQKDLDEKAVALASMEVVKVRDLLDSARSLNSGIAHELRTPIQAILNSLELMNDNMHTFLSRGNKRFPEFIEMVELIDDASESTSYCLTVLNSLSAYARSGHSKEIHNVDVVAELKTIMRNLTYTDGFKTLTEEEFKLEYDDEQGCCIEINKAEFTQLMTNLCKNALEAIRHQHPKITIKVVRNGILIGIKVIDNGCGIANDLGDEIFKPYFSTKDCSQEHNQGLGLAIVNNIVLSFGGKIQYVSKPGRTEFTVSFKCIEGMEEIENGRT